MTKIQNPPYASHSSHTSTSQNFLQHQEWANFLEAVYGGSIFGAFNTPYMCFERAELDAFDHLEAVLENTPESSVLNEDRQASIVWKFIRLY